MHATTPPTSASALPDISTLGAPPLCPCGEKLKCIFCHHQRDHDGTPECAGEGSSQPRKRPRLEDGNQLSRNSQDAEPGLLSGTTSASQQPADLEDLANIRRRLTQVLEDVSSLQQRQAQASRARITTDVSSRPRPSSIPSVSGSVPATTLTSTAQYPEDPTAPIMISAPQPPRPDDAGSITRSPNLGGAGVDANAVSALGTATSAGIPPNPSGVAGSSPAATTATAPTTHQGKL